MLAEGLAQGVTESVMEVSSHALEQQRVFGIPFDVAVFTNLTRDHLDYHGTMEEYFRAKQVLFEGCGTEPPRVAVLNIDDEYGRQLLTLSKKKSSRSFSYGLTAGDFHAESIEITPRGTRFQMVTPAGKIRDLVAADRQGERLQRARRRGRRIRARLPEPRRSQKEFSI